MGRGDWKEELMFMGQYLGGQEHCKVIREKECHSKLFDGLMV